MFAQSNPMMYGYAAIEKYHKKAIKKDGIVHKREIRNIRRTKAKKINMLSGQIKIRLNFSNDVCLQACDQCIRGDNFCDRVIAHDSVYNLRDDWLKYNIYIYI